MHEVLANRLVKLAQEKERNARADPEEGGCRVSNPQPPEQSQNIGFLSKTGPDPPKKYKATKPAFMAVRWRADDGPLIVVFKSSFPSSTKHTKNVVNFGSPQLKLSWSAHVGCSHDRRCWVQICKYFPKDLPLSYDREHFCGCMRHTCLPNASPNHVTHPIGWFKLVINLRNHASLKPLF